jgi:hypothetical protein
MSMTVSAGTGALPPGPIAEVSVEIDPGVIALQEITLDRVGYLTGRLEVRPGSARVDASLFERCVGCCHNLLLTRMLALKMGSIHRNFRRP